MVNTSLEALMLIFHYVPFFGGVIVCSYLIFKLHFTPRFCARKLLLEHGYSMDEATIEINKDIEEILETFPLDHRDEKEREMNLQIYRILINEDKISEKGNLFRVVGYNLKEKDKMMIQQINLQYNTSNKKGKE